LLDREAFWDNRDWDWYAAHVPFPARFERLEGAVPRCDAPVLKFVRGEDTPADIERVRALNARGRPVVRATRVAKMERQTRAAVPGDAGGCATRTRETSSQIDQLTTEESNLA
jgi:hypothetical protein